MLQDRPDSTIWTISYALELKRDEVRISQKEVEVWVACKSLINTYHCSGILTTPFGLCKRDLFCVFDLIREPYIERDRRGTCWLLSRHFDCDSWKTSELKYSESYESITLIRYVLFNRFSVQLDYGAPHRLARWSGWETFSCLLSIGFRYQCNSFILWCISLWKLNYLCSVRILIDSLNRISFRVLTSTPNRQGNTK